MKRLKNLSLILILLATFFNSGIAQEEYKNITLEDIFKKGVFRTKSVYGLRSMNDGLHYTTMESGKYIVKFSYQTGEMIDTLLNADDFENVDRFFSYNFSNDEDKILIGTNRDQIYSH